MHCRKIMHLLPDMSLFFKTRIENKHKIARNVFCRVSPLSVHGFYFGKPVYSRFLNLALNFLPKTVFIKGCMLNVEIYIRLQCLLLFFKTLIENNNKCKTYFYCLVCSDSNFEQILLLATSGQKRNYSKIVSFLCKAGK